MDVLCMTFKKRCSAGIISNVTEPKKAWFTILFRSHHHGRVYFGDSPAMPRNSIETIRINKVIIAAIRGVAFDEQSIENKLCLAEMSPRDAARASVKICASWKRFTKIRFYIIFRYSFYFIFYVTGSIRNPTRTKVGKLLRYISNLSPRVPRGRFIT